MAAITPGEKLTLDIFGMNSDKERAKSKKYVDDIISAAGTAKSPELQDYDPELYKYTGDLQPELVDAGADVNWENVDPKLAEAVLQGRSEMEGIETDPRLRDAQMNALLSLQDISDRGGRSAEDDANLARIQNEVAQADRGRRDAIKQNMAQRGMGGSGMELLAQLNSSQAATDRSAQQGLDIAALAQLRQQDALMNAGQLGGSIRGQDFGEKSEIASAQDAINRFNASTQTQNNQFNAGTVNDMARFNTSGNYTAANNNRNIGVDVSKANAGIKNSAQERNLDAQQNIGNAKVDVKNGAQKINNIELPQQRFENDAAVRGEQREAGTQGATFYGNKAKDKDDAVQKKKEGIGKVVGAVVSSDERCKEEIEDVKELDIDQFLASLEPKKYEYKSKKDGQGKYTGVMAQDLLKSALGSEAVVEDESGKLGYDSQKIQGITLAALKRLSDKIDEKE